ncbi:hypothetical protein [Xylocopilactobacillus apis]|uniref:Uncharacterized protein n=1 Tax=Xylocopilactobacillus apis TaxID=2932183 RepID=A0AAU9DQU0_9LACO|nr:hypothetical protein [Xylocopilactobacillus apis]BDR57488.1 hypothetical protein KIMC2_20500 [Xylocopilactobacillus apis]
MQNAGPSDGIVDWYPAKDALGDNPTGQELVKELIDLSIATNDSSSNARKVLFNDTVGNLNDIRSEYKTTYDKYPVALGFIAQILNFNNSKSGLVQNLNKTQLTEIKIQLIVMEILLLQAKSKKSSRSRCTDWKKCF